MDDALAASVELLETGVTAGAQPLSRRGRVLPVSFDVVDDLAVTVFLVRGHGGAFWEQHVLTRSDGVWQRHGGGGSGPDRLDVLTRVPTADELGGPARADGAGGVVVAGAGRFGRSRWAQYVNLQVAPEVAAVETPDGRALHRPAHGRLAAVWWGRRSMTLTLRDATGSSLGPLRVGP